MADFSIDRSNRLADWLDSTFNNIVLTDLRQKAGEKRAETRHKERLEESQQYTRDREAEKLEIKNTQKLITDLNFNIPSEQRVNPDTEETEIFYPAIDNVQSSIDALNTKYKDDEYMLSNIQSLQNNLNTFSTFNQQNQDAEDIFRGLVEESKNITGEQFKTGKVDELQKRVNTAENSERQSDERCLPETANAFLWNVRS